MGPNALAEVIGISASEPAISVPRTRNLRMAFSIAPIDSRRMEKESSTGAMSPLGRMRATRRAVDFRRASVARYILHHVRDRLLAAHDLACGPCGIEFHLGELLPDLRQHVLVFRNCVARTQMRSCRYELRAFPLQRAGQLSSEADASAGEQSDGKVGQCARDPQR